MCAYIQCVCIRILYMQMYMYLYMYRRYMHTAYLHRYLLIGTMVPTSTSTFQHVATYMYLPLTVVILIYP